MNSTIVPYLVTGTPIAALAIVAAAALRRHHENFSNPLDSRQRSKRLGLQLLLAQTLIPAVQFIVGLNVDNNTHRLVLLFLNFSLQVLAGAALVLFLSTEFLLVCNSRGASRIFLPLLSLLAFLFSIALVLVL